MLVVYIIGIKLIFWPNREEKKADLPRIELVLDSVSIDEINNGSKEEKYNGKGGTLMIDDTKITLPKFEIKGRGNSTWNKPKNPYQVKFNEKVDLPGLGARKKWVLLANYIDWTHLRNDTMFKMAEMIQEKYARTGEFVELMVDGQNLGVYYIVRKIEIKKDSVDLRDELGVLVEFENLHDDSYCYETDSGNCLMLKDLVNEDLEEKAMTEFLKSYNEFEKAAKEGDFKKVSELVDVESFAEYFLLSEFSANPDAYTSSQYLYRDGLSDKIHIGPAWDFDFALGNENYYWRENDELISSTRVFLYGSDENNIFSLLSKMPEFREVVRRIFRERLSGKEDELVGYVKGRAEMIRESVLRDGVKFRFEEEDEEHYEDVEFDESVIQLINWIRVRYRFFEQRLGSQGMVEFILKDREGSI